MGASEIYSEAAVSLFAQRLPPAVLSYWSLASVASLPHAAVETARLLGRFHRTRSGLEATCERGEPDPTQGNLFSRHSEMGTSILPCYRRRMNDQQERAVLAVLTVIKEGALSVASVAFDLRPAAPKRQDQASELFSSRRPRPHRRLPLVAGTYSSPAHKGTRVRAQAVQKPWPHIPLGLKDQRF